MLPWRDYISAGSQCQSRKQGAKWFSALDASPTAQPATIVLHNPFTLPDISLVLLRPCEHSPPSFPTPNLHFVPGIYLFGILRRMGETKRQAHHTSTHKRLHGQLRCSSVIYPPSSSRTKVAPFPPPDLLPKLSLGQKAYTPQASPLYPAAPNSNAFQMQQHLNSEITNRQEKHTQ